MEGYNGEWGHDDEYFDAKFAFYNEEVELMTVNMRDTLDTMNLRYYMCEELDATWMVEGLPTKD